MNQTAAVRRAAQSRLWMWLGVAGAAAIFAIAALLWGVLWAGRVDRSRLPPGQTEPAAAIAQVATATAPPPGLSPTAASVAAVSPTPVHSPLPTDTPAATATLKAGQILEIDFCDRPCQEAGAQQIDHFPEGAIKVYAAFRYQGMQKGTRYTRIWSMDGVEWVRYNCEWQGLQDGVYDLLLWDMRGLSSGAWMVSIQIEGQPPFVDAVTVDGSFKNWQPNGLLPCTDW